jgi:DnaJ-class molecular chaperone
MSLFDNAEDLDHCEKFPQWIIKKPVPHTEMCPVCSGSGEIIIPQVESTSATPLTKTCHGCGGTGWVTVR